MLRIRHFALPQRTLLALAAAACLGTVHDPQPRVTRILVEDIQPLAPALGQTVVYQQVSGRAFGELDPRDPLNAIIQDIELGKDPIDAIQRRSRRIHQTQKRIAVRIQYIGFDLAFCSARRRRETELRRHFVPESPPFLFMAKAQPAATGIIDPRWLIMPTWEIPASSSKRP